MVWLATLVVGSEWPHMRAVRLLPGAPSLDLDPAFQRGVIGPGYPALDGPATRSPSHPQALEPGSPRSRFPWVSPS